MYKNTQRYLVSSLPLMHRFPAQHIPSRAQRFLLLRHERQTPREPCYKTHRVCTHHRRRSAVTVEEQIITINFISTAPLKAHACHKTPKECKKKNILVLLNPAFQHPVITYRSVAVRGAGNARACAHRVTRTGCCGQMPDGVP